MCSSSPVIIFIIITSLPNNTRSGVLILVHIFQMREANVDELQNLADFGEIEQILKFTGNSPPKPSNPNQPLFLKNLNEECLGFRDQGLGLRALVSRTKPSFSNDGTTASATRSGLRKPPNSMFSMAVSYLSVG